MVLSIDLETFSTVDIKKGGLYKYAEHSEILLFAYAFNDDPVAVIDFTAGEKLPPEVLDGLRNPNVTKTAFNAAFEMQVLRHAGIKISSPMSWRCTMVLAYRLGLPGSLEAVGEVIGLPQDKQKLKTGKKLIKQFCVPKKGGTRNLPSDALFSHDWEDFKEYCRQDVEAERAIRAKLEPHDTKLVNEHRLWALDQYINDAGVLVDMELAAGAVKIDAAIKARATKELKAITGLSNPNSNTQFLNWFEAAEGYRPDTIDKAQRKTLLQSDIQEETRRALELKETLSKSSVSKYKAMQESACEDGRVHGMLQFYGASRTGRWAGRLVQIHNLPQNHLDDLDTPRAWVRNGDLDALDIFYDNPSDTLSQLIRTTFVAPEGARFIVADFSAIEARVIAWLADEAWRQDAFKEGQDIYCASASQMFGVPVEKHGANKELRQKGKVAELACGYGGGINALKAFGADKMGLTDADMQSIIDKWRASSPNICSMWREVESNAKQAIRNKGTAVKYKHGVSFLYDSGILFITLPSGRRISYIKPRIEVEAEYGRETLTYEGTVQTSGGWGRGYTWGGKLVENIVQATARDCLAVAMLALDAEGYKIVMHVHDEVVLEMSYGEGSLDEAIEIMSRGADWSEGLVLNADGYETEYYKKD